MWWHMRGRKGIGQWAPVYVAAWALPLYMLGATAAPLLEAEEAPNHHWSSVVGGVFHSAKWLSWVSSRLVSSLGPGPVSQKQRPRHSERSPRQEKSVFRTHTWAETY